MIGPLTGEGPEVQKALHFSSKNSDIWAYTWKLIFSSMSQGSSIWHVTCDMRHATCDIITNTHFWAYTCCLACPKDQHKHLTYDIRHAQCDMWHATCEIITNTHFTHSSWHQTSSIRWWISSQENIKMPLKSEQTSDLFRNFYVADKIYSKKTEIDLSSPYTD